MPMGGGFFGNDVCPVASGNRTCMKALSTKFHKSKMSIICLKEGKMNQIGVKAGGGKANYDCCCVTTK